MSEGEEGQKQMRQNCQPMSLSPGAVLRYGVIGCAGQSALEPWQLGAQPYSTSEDHEAT